MNNKPLLIGLILASLAYGVRIGMRYTYLGPLTNIFTDSAFLITIVLSLGTFMGIFLLPLIGKRSDRTWTRFGRRRPYLMVSIPLVSIFTSIIPHASSFTILIAFVILEALAGIIGLSPLVSLIPDNFETKERGRANAIFMLCMGLGGVCAAGIGYKIWDINYHLVFYIVAAIIFVFGVTSLFLIKETPFPDNILSGKSQSIVEYFRNILSDKRVTLYYAGDFFRWFSKSLIIQMVTLFAANELGVKIGVAGQAILVFNLLKLISSLPVGTVTDKVNRKQFLLVGTVLLAGSLYYGWCCHSFVQLSIAMGLFGISASITLICGSSLLMDLFPKGRAGEFMGMNMVFGCLPTVLSLWISGALIDLFGTYRLIFLIGIISTIISFIFTLLIPKQES